MSTLGIIHMVFGVVALLSGLGVVFLKKGTRWHRTLGHLFLTSMLSLNASAFFIYNLFGKFGPFHWLAISSLITIIGGMIPVFTRRPKGRWMEQHAIFMNFAYIGLVAATAAEITSRIPAFEENFGWVVGLTSALIIGIGATILFRKLPHNIRRTRSQFPRFSK